MTKLNIFMAKKLFPCLIFIMSPNTFAAPASIPNHFHGFWSTEESCRQMNSDGIDRPSVELDKSYINLPFSSCKLKTVKKSDSQNFSGQFACSEEGEVSKRNIEVTLDGAAKLSVKGADELVGLTICKLKKR